MLLDWLEQRGYLRRAAAPSGRRRLRLAPTEAGVAASLALARMLSREIAAYPFRTPVPRLDALEQALDLSQQVVDDLEHDVLCLGSVLVNDEDLGGSWT